MRPGPSTGMPTRTSQEDLNLVLYAGAGFFPRIIFAPGTIEDAFHLTQQAFNLTQKYQVPVFILTDQYLVDSYYNLSELPLDKIKVEKHIIKTDKDYERYTFTKKGIQPRGIPGWGEGLVDADSHEHDEHGNITEDEEIRNKKVEKRFRKLEMIREDMVRPEFIGNQNDYEILIISWGSNYYIIKEALEKLERNNIGYLHFNQLFPVHSCIKDFLTKAKTTIAIEQNPTGQFARLLENETHINIDHRILKHSGYTFSVEEIKDKITKCIKGRDK
jgi:2-oxoglutarate ferredoxin oxidoreductase subunit alpha